VAQIEAHAAREYPHECCGVLLVRDRPNPGRLLVPCRNEQNELHAKNPQKYPRDARTAYNIHSQDLLAITLLESKEGYTLAIIYHSHVDAGAYFSDTDKKAALIPESPNPEVMYPGVAYVVVSVLKGKVAETAAFRWDAAKRDFLTTELRIL
jgi:proteasome lid subunit RPN8/RPN11